MPIPQPSRLGYAIAMALLPAGAVSAQAVNETMVITASGFEQKVTDAPASITVITREDLEQKRVASIADALSDVEGVDVGGSVGKTGGLNISMRGMPSDYTLILIDGRRQNNVGNVTPNGFGETANSFMPPVAAIERIEVIRGPMSTLYGSDAMGGVVNIITRKPAKEWMGALTLENTQQQHREFGNSAAISFYTSGALIEDKLGLTLRGSVFDRSASDLRYQDANGLEKTPIMGANPVKSDIQNLGGRVTFTPTSNQDIWLDIDRGNQEYDNSEGQLGTLDTPTKIGGYEKQQRYTRDQYVLAHDGRFSFGNLSSSITRSETDTAGRTLPKGVPGKTAGAPRTLELENTIVDSKLVTVLGDNTLSVGGQWWKAEMIDGVATAPFEHKQLALFAEDEWRFLTDWALTVGARYDDHSVFGSQLSPRGYLVWNASSNWTFKGGVSQGYKTPRLDQLTSGIVGFGRQGALPLIGTPSLTPETTTSSELAAYYQADNGFNANLTLFQNNFNDKIASGTPVANCHYSKAPNQPGCVDIGTSWNDIKEFGQTVNIDEAITRGVEVGSYIPLAEYWDLKANYTFTDSEQKSGSQAGQPLTDTPKHMVNMKLNWQTTAQLNTWLQGEYRSKRWRGVGAEQEAFGDYNAFTLFHLGASYRISENVTVNGTIYNLLDEDFLQYHAYNDAGKTAYANEYNNNQEGRRFWISTNITF